MTCQKAEYPAPSPSLQDIVLIEGGGAEMENKGAGLFSLLNYYRAQQFLKDNPLSRGRINLFNLPSLLGWVVVLFHNFTKYRS